MMESPQFPPLLTGEAVPRHMDPFDKAVSRAIAGVDSGTVFYSEVSDTLQAARVLAPEAPLEQAIQAVYVAQIGLAGSWCGLAPPEVRVHFPWSERGWVNGSVC